MTGGNEEPIRRRMWEARMLVRRFSERVSTSVKDFFVLVFFFQAEDGIRDVAVTGVQTCALPISNPAMLAIFLQLLTYRGSCSGIDCLICSEFIILIIVGRANIGCPIGLIPYFIEIGRASCRERV